MVFTPSYSPCSIRVEEGEEDDLKKYFVVVWTSDRTPEDANWEEPLEVILTVTGRPRAAVREEDMESSRVDIILVVVLVDFVLY